MTTTDPGADLDREALEQERAFLLRSLADLDDEYEAGDLDDDDYRSLTDDYTARTAAVLRAIEALAGPRDAGPRGAARRSDRGASPGLVARRALAGPRDAGRRGAARRSDRGASPGLVARRALAGPRDAGRRGAGRRSDRGPASPGLVARRALAGPRDAGPRDSAQSDELSGRSPTAPGRTPAGPTGRRWRALAVVLAVVGFGAVTVWAVTQSSGKRQAGQTITGNGQLTTTTLSGGVDNRLSQASSEVNNGDVADALKLYDAILKDDAAQPVALAYGGWLEANAGLAANRPDLVDAGLVEIVKSEQVAPTFADPHFFRGYLLLHAKNDPVGAVTELRIYLAAADPSGPQIPAVQQDLADAIKAAGPSVPAGPNAATTIPVIGPTPSVTTKP